MRKTAVLLCLSILLSILNPVGTVARTELPMRDFVDLTQLSNLVIGIQGNVATPLLLISCLFIIIKIIPFPADNCNHKPHLLSSPQPHLFSSLQYGKDNGFALLHPKFPRKLYLRSCFHIKSRIDFSLLLGWRESDAVAVHYLNAMF